MKFFHLPTSCSAAVRAVLGVTGEPHEEITVDVNNKSDEFMSANPLGKVPALILEDTPIFEGGAINLWLAMRNPDAGLMPELDSVDGAEALKWMFFVYTNVHPAWMRVFYPERVAGEGNEAVAKELAIADLERNYGLIAEQLRQHDYVAGPTMTIADIYLSATLHWDGLLGHQITNQFPELRTLRDRVSEVPEIARAFEGEFAFENAA